MTKKPRSGTLSTKGPSDKKGRAPAKEANVTAKMKGLLDKNQIRFHSHANSRMAQRGVIYYEVLQALNKGKHEPSRDRFSTEHSSWEYSFLGKTLDDRELRIGVAFEANPKSNERLLVITVIDPNKED